MGTTPHSAVQMRRFIERYKVVKELNITLNYNTRLTQHIDLKKGIVRVEVQIKIAHQLPFIVICQLQTCLYCTINYISYLTLYIQDFICIKLVRMHFKTSKSQLIKTWIILLILQNVYGYSVYIGFTAISQIPCRIFGFCTSFFPFSQYLVFTIIYSHSPRLLPGQVRTLFNHSVLLNHNSLIRGQYYCIV